MPNIHPFTRLISWRTKIPFGPVEPTLRKQPEELVQWLFDQTPKGGRIIETLCAIANDTRHEEMTPPDSTLETALNLLRDNKNSMHFDRELTTADHDVLRSVRNVE